MPSPINSWQALVSSAETSTARSAENGPLTEHMPDAWLQVLSGGSDGLQTANVSRNPQENATTLKHASTWKDFGTIEMPLILTITLLSRQCSSVQRGADVVK